MRGLTFDIYSHETVNKVPITPLSELSYLGFSHSATIIEHHRKGKC
jgi:hypothetical protein